MLDSSIVMLSIKTVAPYLNSSPGSKPTTCLPTWVTYSASVVKIYNTSSLVRFYNTSSQVRFYITSSLVRF
jgi:hypothetical protein